MKDRPLPRCCFCFETVSRRTDEVFELTIDDRNAAKVTMRWHQCGDQTCADDDPMHQALANALGQPNGDEADVLVAEAYMALIVRTGDQHGAVGLRACIDVRRDEQDPRVTMRGPGLAWGRRTTRV